MKNLRNSVQLIGHIGKTPEITNLEKGKKLARFTIATNEGYTTNDGNKVTNTTWHNIVAWDVKADFVEKNLLKGNEVIVQGRISNRTYTDKSGQTRYISEIILSEVMMTQKKSEGKI